MIIPEHQRWHIILHLHGYGIQKKLLTDFSATALQQNTSSFLHVFYIPAEIPKHLFASPQDPMISVSIPVGFLWNPIIPIPM